MILKKKVISIRIHMLEECFILWQQQAQCNFLVNYYIKRNFFYTNAKAKEYMEKLQ
jgi:hypothetical protein